MIEEESGNWLPSITGLPLQRVTTNPIHSHRNIYTIEMTNISESALRGSSSSWACCKPPLYQYQYQYVQRRVCAAAVTARWPVGVGAAGEPQRVSSPDLGGAQDQRRDGGAPGGATRFARYMRQT